MKDLRVLKTEKAIKEAFIELVEEKGFAKVKISDICEKAMINRNTFYLHYYDKGDLIQKMVSDIFAEQTEMMRKGNATEFNISSLESIRNAIEGLLQSFYKEIEFYRLALLDLNMRGYITKSKETLKKELIESFSLDVKKYHFAIDYIFNGIMGVITEWIVKDNSTIPELTDFIFDIAMNDLMKYIILK